MLRRARRSRLPTARPNGRTAAARTADDEAAVLYADVRKMLDEALDWELGFRAGGRARSAARAGRDGATLDDEHPALHDRGRLDTFELSSAV